MRYLKAVIASLMFSVLSFATTGSSASLEARAKEQLEQKRKEKEENEQKAFTRMMQYEARNILLKARRNQELKRADREKAGMKEALQAHAQYMRDRERVDTEKLVKSQDAREALRDQCNSIATNTRRLPASRKGFSERDFDEARAYNANNENYKKK